MDKKKQFTLINILIFLFFFIFILSLLETNNKYFNHFLFYFFTIILFLVCAFRPSGIDRDYETYVSAFYGDNISNAIFEPSFIFISYLVATYFKSNTIYLFIIYSLLGVVIKSFAIKKISNFYLLSLLLYFSYFFTLHEMTQIRIGAACSIFLLSIPSLYNRNKIKYFILVIISILLHFTSILLLFLWFINFKKLNKYSWFLIMIFSIFVGILFKSFIIYFFENFNFGPLQNKILAYQSDNNTTINIFNIWTLTRICLISFLIYKSDLLIKKNKYSLLLIKIYIISISSYYILSFNPAFASRISDMLGIVEIILFPMFMYLFTPKILPKFLIFFIASMFLFLNLYYLKLLD